MLDTDGRPHGTCSHTDTEYDNLSGYVTGNYVSEWQDKTGTRWRTTVTVVNLGKPDRGTPADPDHAMTPERLFLESERGRNYSDAITAKREQRHNVIMDAFTTHMQEHGPVAVNTLMQVIGKSRNTVLDHLALFPDTYRCFPGFPDFYGLHGQERKTERKEYVGWIGRMRDALLECGPMTANELADTIGWGRVATRTTLSHYDDAFVRVARSPQLIWGVVGIHNGEVAA